MRVEMIKEDLFPAGTVENGVNDKELEKAAKEFSFYLFGQQFMEGVMGEKGGAQGHMDVWKDMMARDLMSLPHPITQHIYEMLKEHGKK